MTKSKVLELYDKYDVYYPPRIFFDIFKDDEEIPNDLLLALFKPREPKEWIVYGSAKFIAKFEESMDNYFKNEYNK